MREQIIDKLGALITAAFGLIAALAWNGFIQAVFVRIFGTKDTIWGMLAYAIIITIIAVFAIIWIARATVKVKEIKK